MRIEPTDILGDDADGDGTGDGDPVILAARM